MSQPSNPYQPPADHDPSTSPATHRWRFLATLACGYFSGAAVHWIVFWTDTLSTEFPPMGGALLAPIVAICISFPALTKPRWLLLTGFALGNVNAAFCRPLHLLNLFNDIPRNFASSWFTAAIAFALCGGLSFAAIRIVNRALEPRLSPRHDGASPEKVDG